MRRTEWQPQFTALKVFKHNAMTGNMGRSNRYLELGRDIREAMKRSARVYRKKY